MDKRLFLRDLRRRLQRFGCANRKQRTNFRSLDEGASKRLATLVREWMKNPDDETDFRDLFMGRLDDDRFQVVPWLESSVPLDGAQVLEIGCGTGASTVALAEQGATVTGIDVDERSLLLARERCALYGLEPDLHCANVLDLSSEVRAKTYDLVVFYASLEHMTLEERLTAIPATWSLVRPGGVWCVIEAPNRLWHYDAHTSWLNFFHWLPDDLAIAYARKSRRGLFAAELAEKHEDGGRMLLARWGRGVSFHEFSVALGDAEDLTVLVDKDKFLRRRNPAFFLLGLTKQRYERFLARLAPSVNPGFYREYLNVMIKKAA